MPQPDTRQDRQVNGQPCANPMPGRTIEHAGTDKNDPGRIVVLMGSGPLPWIMINSLTEHFGPVTVLEEDHEPKKIFLKRRLKMHGPVTVAGQIGFGVLLKFLHKKSAPRKQAIMIRINFS